jgi:2,6-dihydroxypyridine 3-monooxygenase
MISLTQPRPDASAESATREEDQPSIAIVGGSITGPALALLLHQSGFTNVSVLEASAQPHAQAGGVIGLDHSSLATLDTLGIPQRELVPFPSERVIAIHVADREEVERVHTLYPGRNTGWHLLNTALLNRLPDGWLQPGKAVRSLGVADDGKARLEFTGGEPVTADMVVFADGRARSAAACWTRPGRSTTPATSPGAASWPAACRS